MANPRGKILRQEYSFAGNFKQDLKKLNNVIQQCHFVHQIDVTLPNATLIPDFVNKTMEEYDKEYYLIRNASVINLIDMDFIGAFVKTGTCYCISIGTRIDVDDCMALIPSGKLVISVTKDTYEELGIEGRLSKFNSSKSNKYIIEIDLTANSFYPGKPKYDKVLQKFNHKSNLTFDLICSWEPHDAEISRRSMYNYFQSQGLNIKICTNRNAATCTYSNPTPRICWDNIEGKEESSVGCKDFFEWLGAVSCDIDLTTSHDAYVSTFSAPEASDIVGQTALTKWTGFLTPSSVQRLVENLKTVISSENFKWVALTAFGYDDTPIVNNNDHGVVFTNGDNFYTLVIFANDNFWLYTNKTLGVK